MQRYYCVKSLSPRWLALPSHKAHTWGVPRVGRRNGRRRRQKTSFASGRPPAAQRIYRVLWARLHNRPFAGEEGGVYFFILFFILLIDKANWTRLKRFVFPTSNEFFLSFCLPFWFNIVIVKSSVNWMYHDRVGRRLRGSLWRIMVCVTCSFLFSSSSIRLLYASSLFRFFIRVSFLFFFPICPSVRSSVCFFFPLLLFPFIPQSS